MVGNYQKWFLNYVETYGNAPEIILKRDHSLRVASNITEIFKLMNLSNDYIFLADFIGLFHDIGRFEQWKNYQTFNDSKSVDHADYSVNNLIQDKLISKIINTDYYNNIICAAIKYHNKLFLPDNLKIKNEQLLKNNFDLKSNLKYNYDSIASLYSMAIRDIDKLDILYQYLISNYFLHTDYLPVSSKVAKDFFDNGIIDKGDRKNLNDTLILRLSFINDINLTKTLLLIKNNDFLNRIRLAYPDKDNLNEFFDYANERLDYLIRENFEHEYVLKK